MKRKRLKKILLIIGCILALWLIMGITDFALVRNFHKPIFCIGVDIADDGGSGRYMGLGYGFDIEGDFLPESTNPGVTSYRGYLFGNEVSRGFWEEMIGTLQEPPLLTVVCGENSTKAMLGTYSWHYNNWNGTITGIEADSMHPLQAKEYMQPLNMLPSYLSHIDPLRAYLQFYVAPDSVQVHCWSEEYWDRLEAASSFEELPVIITENDSVNGVFSTVYSFELKEGNYIYMITAKWDSSEEYGGTAYYSFYTTYPLLEPQLIEP